MSQKPLTYHDAGVHYDVLDAFKRSCQSNAGRTVGMLAAHGMREAAGTRGESCYLVETADEYLAHVEEALGTKILVADAVYAATGRRHDAGIAYDDVATIVNDLVSCGALPTVVAMYAAVGDDAYLADPRRAEDLARGFADACAVSGAAWGGGETQTLRGMVTPGTVILGGSAMGRIAPKSLRVAGDVRAGDAIVCLASSGVHTNGLTLCRAVAERAEGGYAAPLDGGRTYGEALLDPSVIYVPFVAACQRAGIVLRYCVHVTGHGWRKLMRLDAPFVYHVDRLPEPQPVFRFLQRHTGLDDREAYGTFNMGVGWVAYVRPDDADRCVETARAAGFDAWVAGEVRDEGGRKGVTLAPLGISWSGESLALR